MDFEVLGNLVHLRSPALNTDTRLRGLCKFEGTDGRMDRKQERKDLSPEATRIDEAEVVNSDERILESLI